MGLQLYGCPLTVLYAFSSAGVSQAISGHTIALFQKSGETSDNTAYSQSHLRTPILLPPHFKNSWLFFLCWRVMLGGRGKEMVIKMLMTARLSLHLRRLSPKPLLFLSASSTTIQPTHAPSLVRFASIGTSRLIRPLPLATVGRSQLASGLRRAWFRRAPWNSSFCRWCRRDVSFSSPGSLLHPGVRPFALCRSAGSSRAKMAGWQRGRCLGAEGLRWGSGPKGTGEGRGAAERERSLLLPF